MAPARSAHGNQPTSTGLGHHFVSPKKARNAKKTQSLVHVPGIGPKSVVPEDTGRRLLPDKMANNLYSAWKALIPTLVDAHLKYSARTHGHPLTEPHPVISACASFNNIDVLACKCSTLVQVLIHHGLFPTAPSQPRMAVSVDLLAFYRALFERSCDAVHALASALKTHYSRRGFQMTNTDGQVIQEPFRRGLGQAVQWYDILQTQVERQTEATVQICRERVYEVQRSQCKEGASILTPTPSKTSLLQGKCASILMQRCPACFGGALFGRPLSDGGDIHVATDGNFHHRHRRSAGDCPLFYEPSYFLPKTQVDEVGRRIVSKRKRAPKIRTRVVPDEAIDQCEHSYEAADGKKQKAAMDSFDDMGVMALICRHVSS
ncbi:hypothetical protein F4604DRAFT_1884256 [Suillus subluteus]|nr:hypothetical protein F4604DRAFT_1884256 [Suillus subluteus]